MYKVQVVTENKLGAFLTTFGLLTLQILHCLRKEMLTLPLSKNAISVMTSYKTALLRPLKRKT